MRSGRRTRPLLGLLAALGALSLVEGGLRLAGVSPAYEIGGTGNWRMAAGLSAAPLHGARDGHAFAVTTNADGLRTQLGRARTPGVTRVALMGDSTVFGWGVDDGGTVADGAQAALDAAGARVEVLNAGQPGYSTTQAAWLFEEVVAAYRPDRVVLFVPMHDYNGVLVSDRERLLGGATLAARARIRLASTSRIYQVLRRAVWPRTDEVALRPKDATGEPRVPRVSDAERGLALDALRATLATWGGTLSVGFLPFHGDIEGTRTDRVGLDWATAYGEAHGVPIVDVRACCVGDAAARVLADDPGHLSAEGNRKVGAAVAAALGPRQK
jgi:lysophospholipase L1-like esterase